jgi:hypothetical protein
MLEKNYLLNNINRFTVIYFYSLRKKIQVYISLPNFRILINRVYESEG